LQRQRLAGFVCRRLFAVHILDGFLCQPDAGLVVPFPLVNDSGNEIDILFFIAFVKNKVSRSPEINNRPPHVRPVWQWAPAGRMGLNVVNAFDNCIERSVG
jgi:hypothetical protein